MLVFNNIYTLIGLNESGKTTLLEAISYITTTAKDDELGLFDSKGFEFLDKPSKLIPIGKLQNFNDNISVEAKISFQRGDKKQMIDYFRNTYDQELMIEGDNLNIEKRLVFENSELTKGPTTYWSVQLKIKDENNNIVELESSDAKWTDVVSYIRKNMIPRILYFPTFLFDFPKKIYLDNNFPAETQNSRKINDYYKKITQDILPDIYESSNSDEKRKILNLLYSNLFLDGKNPLFSIRKPLEDILSRGHRLMWSD